MTATLDRPTDRPSGSRPPRRRVTGSAARRTLLAFVASACGIVPLKGLFTDTEWLVEVWLAMAVVLVPAALLRLRRAPGALDIWPGIVLLVPWLTARFLGDTAALGFVPTGETWTRLSQLMTQLHETTRNEVAPIETTPAVRLVVCALLALLAALIDLIAVVGRRAALAGVPLLVVFTIAGAVPRTPVAWSWFVVGAVGFLLLLALDSGDDLERWGRRVRSPDGRTPRTALAVAAPRIAVAALVAAVALPLLVPGEPRNLLAEAFRGGDGGSGVFGGGGGDNGRISPFAQLKGELTRKTPRQLAEVQMLSRGDAVPYYLRVNVLSDYTDDGWRAGERGDETPAADGDYPVEAEGDGDTVTLDARVNVTGMRGNPPVFALPERIDGLPGDTRWSSQDQLLLGSDIGDGTVLTQRFRQPAPTVEQLRAAGDRIDPAVRSQLTVPGSLPEFVRTTVRDTIAGVRGQYAKARALSDFFADPENGFEYDLQTQVGDSGSLLVDFLQNRRGFCQQYAAALAIMLRVAKVPARVVLGYMHPDPNAQGRFAVRSTDAHAWVEAWFEGVGWVPFDPTPAAGRSSAENNLPWAPQNSESNSQSSAPSAATSSVPTQSSSAAQASSSAAAPRAESTSGSSTSLTPFVVALLVLAVLALLFLPALLRAGRRRRRLAAARRAHDTESLWAELSDTAVDLGYVWSDARSPRQVAAWLGKDVPTSADGLQQLATAVERDRYAGGSAGGDPDQLEQTLRRVTDELRGRRTGRDRARARFVPASLGWTAGLASLFSGRRR
ncbi:transglutaminase TgpA family protein [Jatrophihabitans fulvus]